VSGPADGATGPPEPTEGAGGIDASRVRSFIGLSVGLVGPRANLAVSGVLITLFVQQRASGALAVTFALTASRLISWITYPVAGRLSDRTRTRVGRRTPYMAISLMVMGAATWLFTVVNGYWALVVMIVIASQAASVFTLTNVAVVPEVFGRSRWLKALVLTTVLGTLASWTIKATVITTWKQSDPATWDLPFQVAGVIMVLTGLTVLLLVREAPSAARGALADRTGRARPARDELRDILAGPNAKVLVTGSLLFWAGIGSTGYVAILFFQRVLHAGASAQTIAGLATGIPVFMIGIALGVPLSRWLTPMQLAIGAPLLGAALAGVQYFDTHLWQAVVLSYIGAPFIGAYIIVMAPLLLQLLPRAGGLGERLGVLLSPFNLVSVVLAYVAAATVDATGNYRLIWLFPAATGLGHALVNCWLKYPDRNSTNPDMVKRLWEWAVVQAESMAETGIVTGLLAAPLLGVVTEEDADSAVVVDMARNILGNPYEDLDEPPALPVGPPQEPSAGGSLGVTGVDQVGGGPAGERENGDQKSGWGDESSSPSSSSSSAPVEGPGSPAGPVTGVPDTGVGSPADDQGGPSIVGLSGGSDNGGSGGSDNGRGDGTAGSAGPGPGPGAGSGDGITGYGSGSGNGTTGSVSGSGSTSGSTPGVPDVDTDGSTGSMGANGDTGAGATDVAGTDPAGG
jgi:Na+/melibiose symporter-like transporter